MAANPFAFDTSTSHYNVLNIPRNATSEDINKAFKKQARWVHPDKSGEQNTESFQRLLHARDTLLNEVKRADYDDEHEDDSLAKAEGFLLCGPRISEHFRQQFTEWEKGFLIIKRSSLQKFPEQFQEMLQKFSNGFLREQTDKAHPKAIGSSESARQPVNHDKSASSPIENTVNLVMQAAGKEQDDSAIQNRIEQIYKRAIDSGYSTGDPESNDLEPIVDFSTSPKEDIKTLVELLSADDPETIEKMNPSQLLGQLLKYVPRKLNHYLTNTSTTQTSGSHNNQCKYCHKNYWLTYLLQYTCVQCRSKMCIICCPISRKIYGYGKTTNVFICNSCFEQFYQEHAKEWRDKAHTLIEGGSLEDLKAAFGCIQIALSLFNEISLTSTGKQLFHHNYPELALPFALAAQQQASKIIDKVKANKFLSSVFKSLTTRYDDQNIRWELLFRAKEAALLAKSEADLLDEQIADAPSLQIAVDEINQELQLSRRQKEDEEARQIRSLRQAIERHWESRNLGEIIDFILSPDEESQRASRLKALEQFLQTMKEFISKMRTDDRYSLTFFRGVLKLSKKRFAEGITDIEQVAWQSHSVDLLKHESINILLSLLKTQPPIFTLNGLHKICTQPQKLLSPKGIYDDFSVRELQLITMDEAEITPPFKGQWPELSVTGLNLRAHRKCEAAFANQIQEKKWGSQDAGYAYIDYIQGCVHPAEITVSLLHASMWFLKDLKENDQIQLPQTFALKKLIFSLLSMAYTIAQRSVHPGMQLYVGRTALAVALETLKRTEDVALAEDTELISALLHMVTYNSRFVPFWKFPSVQVSEAALLSIISAELHTKYLDQLTEIDKTQRPMTEAELQYQLYENDLRYVYRAEDPASLHVKAMKELLAEKGWKLADVSRLMTSSLSPRDRDGWLIQQPKLGLNQEFAEIKGMIINLNHHNPSIELVVVPADDLRGRMGICSQTDFQHVLSMVDEADGTLYFSLDQPDNRKRFHPFQEFQYTSESLNKSDLLHTLFETDYLMKSFSVGTDVSSKPPFKQRPNKEGLTKNLPKRLQEKLKPVSERGTTQNRAHRFWIQADKIDYNEEQNNNRLEIRLGEMDMIIRSHPLIRGEDGKLIDTKEDGDPDSPEARFAADMTEVYNELGLHFPMFLRLRQLAKLQVLGLFLRGILKGMKEKSEGKGIVVPTELLQEIQRDALQSAKEQLQRGLNSISSDIGEWPAAEDRNTVSTEVARVLRELPYNVIASYSDVEPHVKSALRKKDDSVVSQLSDALMDATSNRLTRSTLAQYVIIWLQNRSSRNLNDLVSYLSSAVSLPTREDIKSQIVAHSKERYEPFSNLVKTLCLPNKQTSTSPCKWVPAALHKEEDGSHLSLCYGGVLIAPKINEGNVPRFPGHSQRVPVQKAPQVFSNATNGLGAQIRNPKTGSKPQTRKTRLQPQSDMRKQTQSAPASQSQNGPISQTAQGPQSQFSGTKSTAQTQSEMRAQTQKGTKQQAQNKTRQQTQSETTQKAQSDPASSQSQNGQTAQGSQSLFSGTKPIITSSTKTKWDFTTNDDKKQTRINLATHAFRLYGDGNPRAQVSETLTACIAVAVGMYVTSKLLETFGDKKMKTDAALREVSKNSNQNPSCKRTNCKSCALNNISPVTSITTTSGRTYTLENAVSGLSVTTSNCIYMVKCIITGKMYFGMTTRQAIVRLSEHLRDISKRKLKTLARHFNSLGCFRQFENYMEITPLAFVSDETMKPYTPSQGKRIMEYIEAKLIETVGREQLLNRVTPPISFSGFDRPPPKLDRLFSRQADGIYIDGKRILR